MNKLIGLGLMLIGVLVLCYVALAVLISKGVLVVLGVIIPLAIGWVLYHVKTDPPRTLKEEVAYARSLFRKAGAKVDEAKATVKDTFRDDAKA